MSEHFIIKCKCGRIIAQCRCPGPHSVEMRDSCDACRDAKIWEWIQNAETLASMHGFKFTGTPMTETQKSKI